MTDSQSQKRILLGITGGIAAYKCAELTRRLKQEGWDVQIAMTEAATRFITPTTMQALSGKPVMTQLWESGVANGMDHIDLSRSRDLILIAPASADFLSKLAIGAADDLLSTLCLARACPLLVAPAMNRQMWDNPATQRNVRQLAADGIMVAGPAAGEQACGETGFGRMLEPVELIQEIDRAVTPPRLAGRRVLITAGPTFEAIDPVRGITNRSSGKMGYSLARAAWEAGARVTMISGPASLPPPHGVRVVHVESARQMLAAVQSSLEGVEVFIAVAAVADYRVANASSRKIKRSSSPLKLELEPNPDILGTVAALPEPPFCVGFAAESEDLDRHAQEKRRRKGIPLLVGNIAQDAIGAEESALVLYDDDGRHPLPCAGKLDNARRIIHHLADLVARHFPSRASPIQP